MSWKASLAAVQAGESPSKPAAKHKPAKSKEASFVQEEEDIDEVEDEEEQAYYAADYGAYGGAASWEGVDEAELEESALDLFDSVTRSMHGSNKGSLLEQLFSADNGMDVKEVLDPLGMGALDLHTNKVVKEGTSASKGAKGQKSKAGKAGRGMRASSDTGGPAPGAAAPPGVLPTQPEFKPEAYLGSFHKDTSLSSLRKGLKTLEREVHERKGLLKQLIRENFGRFTSCQQTIDDIYVKLQQADGMVTGVSGKASKQKPSGVSSPRPGQAGGLEGLQRSLAGVQSASRDTWGDVLDRAHKAERIKSVAALLTRFSNLFGMPARIKALAAEAAWSQIVAEYKRANALISPAANTGSRVWMALYQEIIKRVLDAQSGCKSQLLAAKLDPDTSPQTITFLAQLSHERLPGSVGEDVMRLTLDAAQAHIDDAMTECDAQLANRLSTFKRQLHRSASAVTAALDFAAVWKLQGATAWQLEGGAPTPSTDIPTTPPLQHVKKQQKNRQHASIRSKERLSKQVRSSSKRVTSGKSNLSSNSPQHQSGVGGVNSAGDGGDDMGSDESVTSGEEEVEEGEEDAHRDTGAGSHSHTAAVTGGVTDTSGAAGAGGVKGGVPRAGLPVPPTSLEDLALLMWPGTSDWQPHLDLTPALRADLQWRLLPTTPRSQLLPEPSFRLSPAQSAWAEYVAELDQVLVSRLPALWAVANSQQYAQVTDVPPAVLESMRRAPSLARRMIESIMQTYQARLQVAMQALSQAGPLCPAVELVIKELCRTYHTLQQSGTSSKAHECVRQGALAALSLYGSCLYAHMAQVPHMLLSTENWALDACLMDQQPVTALPRLLQEELCLVLFHFGMLSCLAKPVDPRATAESWDHIRKGFMACVTALTDSVTQQAGSVRKRVQAAAARQGSWSNLSDRPSGTAQAAQALALAPLGSGQLDELHLAISLQDLLLIDPVPGPSGGNNPGNGNGNATTTTNNNGSNGTGTYRALTAQDSSAGYPLLKEEASLARSSAQSAVQGVQGMNRSSLVRNMTETGMVGGGRGDAGALQRGMPAAGGGLSGCEEARVLILASNAQRVRCHVVPAVMQQYSQQLTGSSPADASLGPDDDHHQHQQSLVDDPAASQFPSQLQGKLRELGAATRQLVDSWKGYRAGLGVVQVRAYLRVVLSEGWGGDSSKEGVGGLGVPAAISDAALALVACLVEGYTMAALYCPHVPLGSVMSHLVSHVIQELSAGHEVVSELASPYGLLQLSVDLQYMKRIWQALLSEDGQQELASLVSHVSDLLSQGLSDLRRSGFVSSQLCPAMQSLMTAASTKKWARELRNWAGPLVDACLERTQSNAACFVDAADALGGDGLT